MAVIYEPMKIGDKNFIHAYSDQRVKIHGGFPEADYDEATDPAELGRTYEETNIPVESDEDITGDEAIVALEEMAVTVE